MADFLIDTQIEPLTEQPGCYRATLSPSWAVWGPNGGYLAAIALRAAMDHSRLPRPASFHCHFLAVGEFAEVELRVCALGGGKRAESLRVDLFQKDRLLLAATVWMVAEELRGFAHDFGRAPDGPRPEALRAYQDLAEDYAQWYPIWRSMEGRPFLWRAAPGSPEWRGWLRFTDTAIRTLQQDAIRQLFWLDFPGWNATIAAHPWPFHYLAPNLDLTVQFHRFAPESTWTLVEGIAPLAEAGIVGCVSRLWSEDGDLLATGTSQHMCRPNPNYAEELERARAMGLVLDEATSS